MSAAPDLSVVIPTADRNEELLASVNALRSSAAGSKVNVEILVIHNGPADAPVIEHDGVRVVKQSEASAALARNRGLQEARAPIVAFVDDDVIVRAGWVDAMHNAFSSPDVVAAVGRIHVAPAGGRPRWLTKELETWFGGLDHGDEPRRLEPGEYGFCGNLAVRATAARAVGGFDLSIGPGQPQRYNDDIEFLARVRERGDVWWMPAAQVEHQVGRERLTRRWLLRRAFDQGRSDDVFIRKAQGARPWKVPRLRDVVGRRWLRTARRLASPSTRRGALLEDGVWRSQRLGEVWEQRRHKVAAQRSRSE
jgi:GT2 family glycosyltransferase